jgi:Cytochrome c554 and c-prime
MPAHFSWQLGVTAVLAASALATSACSQHDGGSPVAAPAYFDAGAMMDPVACQPCHADQFAEWSGSMHAYASDDPVFIAMNQRGQRETGGQLGDFCLKCHAPMAVRAGATSDGSNLDSLPRSLKGVTCFFCHSIDAVVGSHNGDVTLSDDLVMRGAVGDPIPNAAHRAAYSPFQDHSHAESADACGACHDIVSPAGAAIERTFSEWQASVFSKATGLTCGAGGCHMNPTPGPIATIPGAPVRQRHSHLFAAVDVALKPGFPATEAQREAIASALRGTLTSALCVTANGAIRVLMDNIGAGHGWPSGAAQDRRAWIELVAYDALGGVIYQSGVVPDGGSVVDATGDPDRWLLRDCMFDSSGAPVSMFWAAVTTEGNELPALTTFDTTDPAFYRTHVVQRFPRTPAPGASPWGMPARVTLKVHLQPIGRDVLDDLVVSGDLDPSVRDAMPTYDVGWAITGDAGVDSLEWTPDTASSVYTENGTQVTCVTAPFGFNVGADKVIAPNHMGCSP